ncbi:hypothetical protein [Shewanella aestuarii]|uniref:Uncharacterized protein n=1 Tax=Shewanella aestuarii TaxID=1028752 RepID=A0A6G9QPR6_9GAMM|nr:hypothetical protein [Shewanella aestuarii]QIR16556.1 hypothetical protein HBH39_18955 [Shewanella aestuarii]
MKIFKALSYSILLLGTAATVDAMPNRTELEVFDNWNVTYLPAENEYWAYTELINGYNVALVASNDVVGPGCRVTNIALFSDIQRLTDEKLTARLMFGESGQNSIEGRIVQSRRPWSAMYGVINTTTKYIDEFVSNVYLTNDKALALTIHDDNEFVAKDVVNMAGVQSAYNRMIERCQLGQQRKFRSTYGFK